MKQQDMTVYPKVTFFFHHFFPLISFVLSGQQLEKDSQEHAGILSRCKKISIISTDFDTSSPPLNLLKAQPRSHRIVN